MQLIRQLKREISEMCVNDISFDSSKVYVHKDV
jgi:hypothetical protein